MENIIAAVFALLFLVLCGWLAAAGFGVGAGFAGVAAFILASKASGAE